MSHLSKKQINICKEKLEFILVDQTLLLKDVDKKITNLKNAREPIPETLEKQKTKLEGILSATRKSFEQMEQGTYGIDIGDQKPIPFSLLEQVPYLKVNRRPVSPAVTCKSGAADHAYGNH